MRKKKKKGKNPFPALALTLTLTLTVTLGPNNPATSHCCQLWHTALSLTHQQYTRESQDHPSVIPGQLKATLDNSGRRQKALTNEHMLMSGCGQGHELAKNV